MIYVNVNKHLSGYYDKRMEDSGYEIQNKIVSLVRSRNVAPTHRTLCIHPMDRIPRGYILMHIDKYL